MDKYFSVIMSVYKNDVPEFVSIALDSILEYQTIKPNEVVLVRDGHVPDELDYLLDEYEKRYPQVLNIIRLEQNIGLGNALKIGVENAKYDIVARMDSDDICMAKRFELQSEYIKQHPDVDIVGGQITEFIDSPTNIVGKRIVPCDNDKIYEFMKSRCAFNHVTVMFRRNAILGVGNYQDWFWNEDYYLWVRMMTAKCVFANVPEVLVNVRTGVGQYARRGGWRYFKSEMGIQRYMFDNHLINGRGYLINVIKRLIVQVLLPNRIRGWVYRTFARE